MSRRTYSLFLVIVLVCSLVGFSIVKFEVVRAGTVVVGDIVFDTIWDVAGSPYWVEDNVTVHPGVNLTIMPGVEVLFNGSRSINFRVLGNLYAVGESTNRISFTLRNPSPGPTERFDIRIDLGGNLTMEHSFFGYGRLWLMRSSDIRIADSEFSSTRGNAIDISECDNVTAERLFIHGSRPDALEIDRTSNLTIESSRFQNNYWGIEGDLSLNFDFLIANNTFENQTQGAIKLSGQGHVVSGNEIFGSVVAIRNLLGGNFTIVANNLHHNWIGIAASWTDNFTIENNHISNNSVRGIDLWDTRMNRVRGNTISDNPQGILAGETDSTEFEENRIVNNDVGMILEYDSTANRVFHNGFISNTVQASDDAFGNLWDDGYPSGGNYWSDYTGPDFYKGPNQDILGSDGIGDDPYVIDNDTEDNYPLTDLTIIQPPSPPTGISAVLIGSDHQDVMISWRLSSDDGAGLNNVVRYDIHRNDIYDLNKGYPLYHSVPNGFTGYVDLGAGDGDPSDYFYYVCAVSAYNKSSCTSNQAGKFTRPLSNGPNLVSIPLIQSDESIEKVLQTVKYDKAWYYDSSIEEWKWYMTFKGYRRGLWNVNHTIGLWVNVTGLSNLTVAGIVPAQTEIQLYKGWNLVSFPSYKSYTVADLKMETGATRVEGMETMPPFPPSRLRVLGDADVLLAGHGYWVRVEADTVWIITAD